MIIPQPKYIIGQNVYAFTKDGLLPFTIARVIITIRKDRSEVDYSFTEYGDWYGEDQIVADYKKAKKRLEDNSSQLIMLLD